MKKLVAFFLLLLSLSAWTQDSFSEEELIESGEQQTDYLAPIEGEDHIREEEVSPEGEELPLDEWSLGSNEEPQVEGQEF